MARRERGRPEAFEAVYEGPEVLDALLARAGSPYRTVEVVSRFRHALEHGAGRDVAIPALFPDEPRFASPDDARRLYGNLFGLWHRVRAGRGAEDDAPVPAAAAAPPEPPPPLPSRGLERGCEVPRAVVEAVWRHLDTLPPREKQRQRDRFASGQPDLAAWVEALALDDVGSVAAQDLVFECWAMFDQAFGDRLHAVPFAELRARETEPPPLEQEQPAISGYVTEVLGLLAEEESGFDPAARAQVERAVATAVAALSAAL